MCCTRLFIFSTRTFARWRHSRNTCYFIIAPHQQKGTVALRCSVSVLLVVQCSLQDVLLHRSREATHLEALQPHRWLFEDHLETCLSNNATVCAWIRPTPGCSLGSGPSHRSPCMLKTGLLFKVWVSVETALYYIASVDSLLPVIQVGFFRFMCCD